MTQHSLSKQISSNIVCWSHEKTMCFSRNLTSVLCRRADCIGVITSMFQSPRNQSILVGAAALCRHAQQNPTHKTLSKFALAIYKIWVCCFMNFHVDWHHYLWLTFTGLPTVVESSSGFKGFLLCPVLLCSVVCYHVLSCLCHVPVLYLIFLSCLLTSSCITCCGLLSCSDWMIQF